jgi:RNA ligase (TIGR02306 family)
MRKLASIQKILDIQPIPDADAIEVATVNGWRVVVKKGEFNVGDLVIYCEVDSWIPTTLAPFLSKGQEPREYDGIKGERLRTVKLRGQLSQGMILPLSVVPGGPDRFGMPTVICEGDDVSERLGIVKYDPPVPACLAGVSLGSFPSQVPKTDEERIQNLTNEWPVLKEYSYEVTEKLEGSSMTVGLINNEFVVCSRNLKLKEVEGNTLWMLARKYDIETRMRATMVDGTVIQGEVIGEGIQGNHYGIKGQDFYVFAIYSAFHGGYVSPEVRRKICQDIGLKHVPVIAYTANPYDTLGLTSVEDMLGFADGQSALNPKVLREGEVWKRVDGQEHFKCVSNKYLLKHG